MKKLKIWFGFTAILMLAVLPVLGQGTVVENSVAVESSAAVAFGSNYVWRGQQLSETFVAQPTVALTYGGFSANLWANTDLDLSETTETDVTLSYSFSSGSLGFDAGYINYAFDGFADTQEFYLSAVLDKILSPSLAVYYDFDEGEGAFLVGSVGHTIPVTEKYALDLGFSASANLDNAIMGVDANGETFTGLYNGEVTLGTSFPAFDAVSISPFAAFSFPLSDDAETALKSIGFDGEANIFYGGVTVSLDL